MPTDKVPLENSWKLKRNISRWDRWECCGSRCQHQQPKLQEWSIVSWFWPFSPSFRICSNFFCCLAIGHASESPRGRNKSTINTESSQTHQGTKHDIAWNRIFLVFLVFQFSCGFGWWFGLGGRVLLSVCSKFWKSILPATRNRQELGIRYIYIICPANADLKDSTCLLAQSCTTCLNSIPLFAKSEINPLHRPSLAKRPFQTHAKPSLF